MELNKISRIINRGINDLLALVFPNVCEVCGDALVDGEDTVCLGCLTRLPFCRPGDYEFNIVHLRLAGHAPIERATSGFYYLRDNRFTRLIHAAKYDGRPRIARWLTRMMLPELISGGFFNGIDMVVPVPLHFTKKLSRGYNQCDHIAAAITEATGIESRSILKCRKKHSSQTHRNAFQRWLNVRDTYGIASEAGELNGKHILVVDDVITTGATLLSCCEAIHSAYPLAKISVLSLAITELQ